VALKEATVTDSTAVQSGQAQHRTL
jgi:hypothetical protein